MSIIPRDDALLRAADALREAEYRVRNLYRALFASRPSLRALLLARPSSRAIAVSLPPFDFGDADG